MTDLLGSGPESVSGSRGGSIRGVGYGRGTGL